MRRSYRGVRFWLENVRKEILFTKPKFYLHSSGDSGVIKKFRSKGAGSTNENFLNNLHSCSLIRSPTCSRYGVKKNVSLSENVGHALHGWSFAKNWQFVQLLNKRYCETESLLDKKNFSVSVFLFLADFFTFTKEILSGKLHFCKLISVVKDVFKMLFTWCRFAGMKSQPV